MTPTLDPPATGLTKSGYGRLTRAASSHARHDGEIRRGNAEAADHVLGHALVQRQREHQAVRERVGDLKRIEQCGHLRFPREAEHALLRS